MLESIRIFKDVKNLRDIFTRLTWEMLEWFAVIPMLMFFNIPMFHIAMNQIPGMAWYYTMIVEVIYPFCCYTGVFVCLLVLGKLIYFPSEIKVYSIQNRITLCSFLLFCLLIVASTCVNGFTKNAMEGLADTGESIFCYFSFFFVFFLLGAVIRTPKRKRLLMRVFAVSAGLHGIAVLVDGLVVPIDCIRAFWTGGYAGGFTNPNHYGYYLSVVVLVSAGLVLWDSSKVWRIIGLVCYLVLAAVLQFNNTLGAFVGVFMGLLFMIIVYRIVYGRISKTSILLLVGFVIVTAGIGFFSGDLVESLVRTGFDLSALFQGKDEDGSGGTGRILLWRLTLGKIAEKPLLGHGVDGFADYLWDMVDQKECRPHNEYLQYAGFFGIPAGISYIVGIFCVYLSGLRQKARMNPETLIALSAAFSYAISAFFGNPLLYTAPYFFIVLGLGFTLPLSAETVQEEPSKDEIEKTA